MRNVRLSVAMSLDGYISSTDGETDWIVMDPEIDFGALMNSFDTVLLGRKTYEATRAMGGRGMPGMSVYVFSRTLSQADCPGVTVSKDPHKVISDLKKQSGKDLWLFGGGELFGSLLSLGLVDLIEVAVIPVLLGGGVPLLPVGGVSNKLKLITNRTYTKTGTVALKYAVT